MRIRAIGVSRIVPGSRAFVHVHLGSRSRWRVSPTASPSSPAARASASTSGSWRS